MKHDEEMGPEEWGKGIISEIIKGKEDVWKLNAVGWTKLKTLEKLLEEMLKEIVNW